MELSSDSDQAPAVDPGDDEIVARVLGGDTDSFELIMRRHNQRLFRLARSVVKDDSEAEDVVQETYVRAFASLRTFEHRAQLGTWLGKIAMNEAIGRLRRRDVAGLDVDELVEGLTMSNASTVTPEQQVSDEEIRPLIEAAVDALPMPFRTVFVLRAVEQLSTQEAADMLGILPDTVKTRFFRARAMLRDNLAARLDSAAPNVFPFLGTRCDRIVSSVLVRIRAISAAP